MCTHKSGNKHIVVTLTSTSWQVLRIPLNRNWKYESEKKKMDKDWLIQCSCYSQSCCVVNVMFTGGPDPTLILATTEQE